VLGLAIIGPLRLRFTAFAVIVGLVYVDLPFMMLPFYANLEKHDPALVAVTQDLGASRSRYHCPACMSARHWC